MLYTKRSNYLYLQAWLLAACVYALAFSGVASGADEGDEGGASNNECPVGWVNGKTFDAEFGPGTSDLTKCVNRRHNVKVVMQINKPCRDSWVNGANEVKNNVANCKRGGGELDFGRSYALGNINNMIKDYETTYGMVQGKDYQIVAVVHSGGGYLLLKDDVLDAAGDVIESGRNKFEREVKNLMERGVKFYFCQNTTRGFIKNGTLPSGNATAQLIDGVEYVTAGVTAISDFQSQGYRYVQP